MLVKNFHWSTVYQYLSFGDPSNAQGQVGLFHAPEQIVAVV